MIGPRVHSLVDLGTATAFFGYALAAWDRDKRVAVSSAGCGLFHLLTSALTDYSGFRNDRLDMEHHARVDLGLAAIAGTIPAVMGLSDKRGIRFFHFQAIVIAGVAGLTDFKGTGENKQLSRIDKELQQEKKAA
jgi:hypothetical protein